MAAKDSPFSEHVGANFSDRTICVQTATTCPTWQQVDNLIQTGDAKKLKLIIRSSHWSVTDSVRHHLWAKLCRRHKMSTSTVYGDLQQEYSNHDKDLSLPGFVNGGSIQAHGLNEDGRRMITRLMCIIHKLHPDITYAPHLYNTAALFLHYMEAEQVFSCLETLLAPNTGSLHQSRISYEASALVLTALLKRHAKKTYDWLKESGRVDKMLSDWLSWIFIHLPFHFIIRIMDCYLNEGIKVLYRAALGVLLHFHKQHAKTSKQQSNMKEEIIKFCKTDIANVTVQVYLKTAFNIRNLSRKEITKMQRKKEMYIQSLHNIQNTRSLDLTDCKAKVESVERHFDSADTKSSVLNSQHWDDIWRWIPERISLLEPRLLFSTSEHGTSLKTFYNNVEDREENPATLLVIKTTNGKIIGAYCSMDWDERLQQDRSLSFFGTGESFVFRLHPEPSTKYPWVGIGRQTDPPASASLFMAGDNTQILIGGGGGVAIRLDEELCHCRSERSQTFENEPLADEVDFIAATVEVFGFVSS